MSKFFEIYKIEIFFFLFYKVTAPDTSIAGTFARRGRKTRSMTSSSSPTPVKIAKPTLESLLRLRMRAKLMSQRRRNRKLRQPHLNQNQNLKSRLLSQKKKQQMKPKMTRQTRAWRHMRKIKNSSKRLKKLKQTRKIPQLQQKLIHRLEN